MTDPKIVDGTIPEFGQSTTKPDTLDAVVTAATNSTTLGPLTDWEQENMTHLSAQLLPIIQQCGKKYDPQEFGKIWSYLNIDVNSISSLFPYALATKQESNCNYQGATKLSVQLPPTQFIRSLLENIYGHEITQTGLYEATGLDIS